MSRDMPEPQRILLIRPSALGDVCRSVHVLVALREKWPNARIDWLVQDTFAEAIAPHPALTAHGGGPLLFPRKAFSKWWKPSVLPKFLRWLRELRRNRYDLVVDAQGLFRSGFFAWVTGSPRRVGFAGAPELAWLGYNEHVPAPSAEDAHTVDRMTRLALAATGKAWDAELTVPDCAAMRLYVRETDRAWARAIRNSSGEEIRWKIVVIAPTSRWAGKLWPGDRFAALAETLLTDGTASVGAIVVVGSASERAQCEPLLAMCAKEPRIVDLVGKTSIGQLMAVIERSSLVIGSDSAALHMAVGLERPIVGLFGPTRIETVGPYRRSGDVLQRLRPGDRLDHKDEASGRELMARITTDEVVSAALTRLRGPT